MHEGVPDIVHGRPPIDPADPAKDDADRLARKQRTSRAKAKTRTDTARELANLPETQDALENGAITDGHAEAIAHARSTADAQARVALDDHEADLPRPRRRREPVGLQTAPRPVRQDPQRR